MRTFPRPSVEVGRGGPRASWSSRRGRQEVARVEDVAREDAYDRNLAEESVAHLRPAVLLSDGQRRAAAVQHVVLRAPDGLPPLARDRAYRVARRVRDVVPGVEVEHAVGVYRVKRAGLLAVREDRDGLLELESLLLRVEHEVAGRVGDGDL